MGSKTWRLHALPSRPGVLVIKVVARRGTFLFVPHIDSFSKSLRDELVHLAQKEGCSWIRVAPLLLDAPDNRALFQKLHFRRSPLHVHPEFAWLLDITPSEEELLAGMRKTTRYSIKKAEKDGIVPAISSNTQDLEKFWKLYNATAERQQFVPFPREMIETEFRVFGHNAFLVLTDFSAAMIIIDGFEAYYHHGASLHHPTASYLTLWTAIQEAKRRGCTTFNFWGVWPETSKPNPQAGLSQFKRGFGGYEEAYVPTQDLPLSPRYWITYAIEKIRKLQRGF